MNEKIQKMFEGKTFVVTGGLGSIGSEIVKQIVQYNPKVIRVIDNRETELYYGIDPQYGKQSSSLIQYYFADIRDKTAITDIFHGADYVFHAAAMKHVLICEKSPFEAVKTNILGTQNVIDACIQNDVEKMILISTDKAVNPNSVMGTTKLLSERMVSAMYNVNFKGKTKFGAVRFGNVLYSRGSVLEIWDEQVKNGKKITLTNPDMSRFVMGIPQSVDLIFSAVEAIENGEIFILKMPSCTVKTLAEAYLELRGLPVDHLTIIKPNEGEKKHEDLLSETEALYTLENERFFVKLPLNFNHNNIDAYHRLGFQKTEEQNFMSNDPKYLLGTEELKKIISKYINAGERYD